MDREKMDKKNLGYTKLQALVPDDKVKPFQEAIDALGLTQQEAFGRLVILFTRLPTRQQESLDYALRDDEGFKSFMLAVDDVVAQSIAGQLPSLVAIHTAGQARRQQATQKRRIDGSDVGA